MNNWINNFLKTREAHANLLYTFSWLEFMGARKIVRSLPNSLLYDHYLNHVIEEFNHARFFKKLSQQICDGDSSCELIPAFAVYFNDVEAHCAQYAKQKRSERDVELIYQVTTYLIERRALAIYEAYAFAYAPHREPLQRILSEEEIHLKEVESQVSSTFGQNVLQKFRDAEQLIFQKMIDSLEVIDESKSLASIF